MGRKSGHSTEPAAAAIAEIRWATREHWSAEDEIRIVRAGPRNVSTGLLPAPCRRPERKPPVGSAPSLV